MTWSCWMDFHTSSLSKAWLGSLTTSNSLTFISKLWRSPSFHGADLRSDLRLLPGKRYSTLKGAHGVQGAGNGDELGSGVLVMNSLVR